MERGGAIASGLEDVRRLLHSPDPRVKDDALDALHQVGQRLDGLAKELGLDQPRAWALLAVRDEIGSHLLAAHVVESFDPTGARCNAILRRAVLSASSRLDTLLGAAEPVAAGGAAAPVARSD